MAARKRAPAWLAAHASIHCTLYLVALAPRSFGETLTAAVTLALIHAVIDFSKARFFEDDAITFCFDQTAHVASILVVASLLPTQPLDGRRLMAALVESPIVYLYVAGYVAIVLGAGHFVQRVSRYFLKRIDQNAQALKPGLRDAGKYIGWLERALIMTFL